MGWGEPLRAVWFRVNMRLLCARYVQHVRLLLELEIRGRACLRMLSRCPGRQRRRTGRELRPRPGLGVGVRSAVLVLMRPSVRLHVSMSMRERIVVPMALPIPMFAPMSIPTPITM